MPKTSARLLALLSLLQTRRDWPGALLAERLDISARTVRRDVDRLRELGYPIAAVKGPEGGYRLDAGAELPPLLFDDEQAVALAVALQLAAGSQAGIEEAAVRALNTIRQVMPSRLRHRIDMLQVTPVEPAARPRVDSGVLLAISAAAHAHEILRFDYAKAEAPDPPDPPRRTEPHHLVTWGGRWYLVAWDLDRADWRTFRVDRITPRIPTGPRFHPRELPGGDVTAYVVAKFRGAPTWPCTGEVIIDRPAALVSTYLRDAVVEELTPTRCRATVGSWSWMGLAATLANFDAPIRVLQPPALRTAFTTLAHRCTTAGQEPDA
ncbi:helix-turn-helix transcriptional regulator [Nocardia takedensis]|uniref:helix-turn-helix transcriptional regulator n=1 Tax=Nocardia takedensis TaxID=259390 RepID=UPI000593ED15|nr:WYL domain-containing protein [Nocardia takedensis]